MTLAYICVFISIFIPVAFAGYAKFGTKGYDNRNPREFLDGLKGKYKRAHYAQVNSYEAFPPFAAGVIIAHLCGAAQGLIDAFAVSFVILRILYGIFYVTDRAGPRSVVWFMAFACIIGLFAISF